MTDHLQPEDFVDVLDNAGSSEACQHVAACAECRRQLDELREVMRESAGVEVPPPSPLFWDHFSNRVREATTAWPVRAPWWESLWRPAAVLAGVAAIILVLVSRPGTVAPASVSPVSTDVAPVAKMELPDDGSWGLVVAIASEYQYADVKDAAQPVRGTADAMIDELTPAQRAELARLLEQQMGEQ
ncbi:MAG TPA: hypothetical protein VFV78_09185 [Vicinamibacterales bacterium]|nr:hypothetical protein [Vicinamibacterales bacterium]